MVKNADGEIVELHCTYDPESKGGMSPDGRKVRGTLHWVSARHALDAELRLYDYLFTKPDPYDVPEGGEFTDNINPESLTVVSGAKLEPSLKDAEGNAALPVHAPGLFLRRCEGFPARRAGLQPDDFTGGYLGEDGEGTREVKILSLFPRPAPLGAWHIADAA